MIHVKSHEQRKREQKERQDAEDCIRCLACLQVLCVCLTCFAKLRNKYYWIIKKLFIDFIYILCLIINNNFIMKDFISKIIN